MFCLGACFAGVRGERAGVREWIVFVFLNVFADESFCL